MSPDWLSPDWLCDSQQECNRLKRAKILIHMQKAHFRGSGKKGWAALETLTVKGMLFKNLLVTRILGVIFHDNLGKSDVA